MTESSIHGSCLCGSVAYEVMPPFRTMIHCHCSRCRKSTGSGHATNVVVDRDQLRWLCAEDSIQRYNHRVAKSFGKWFCTDCGSPVPRLTRSDQKVVIPAGSLDAAPPVNPTGHIFWASRAPWACGSQGLPVHDEYPESW